MWFFRVVVILFAIQALWVALSNRYPMAFDENFHLGVIQLYANHHLPFWTSQPEGANAFSAIFRDPSYLYHYIFGWIYNVIELFTGSQTTQVLILRFMNIGLFVWALYVYRRLLLTIGASSAATNALVLIFTLIPVASLLAGQINYDNLFIPLVGLLMIWLLEFIRKLKKTQKVDTESLLKITCLGLFGSLVKYAYLPFFVAGVGLVALFLAWNYRLDIRSLRSDLLVGFKKLLQNKVVACTVCWSVLLVLSLKDTG